MARKKRHELFRITEVKAENNVTLESKRSQFLRIEELIFRNELAILLSERSRQLAIQPIGLMKEQRLFALDMPFIRQNTEYICQNIQKRLTGYNVYVEKAQIQHYLQNIDRVFRAALAQGKELSAIPYTEAEYSFKSFKKKDKPKQGQTRPVIVFDKIYPSVRAAHRDNAHMSYSAIQQMTLKERKRVA